MICKKCGTTVKNTAKYCTKCGSIMEKQTTAGSAPEKSLGPINKAETIEIFDKSIIEEHTQDDELNVFLERADKLFGYRREPQGIDTTIEDFTEETDEYPESPGIDITAGEIFDPAKLAEAIDKQAGYLIPKDEEYWEDAEFAEAEPVYDNIQNDNTEPSEENIPSDKKSVWFSKKIILSGMILIFVAVTAVYLIFFSSFFHAVPGTEGPVVSASYDTGQYTELIWVQLTSDLTNSAIYYTVNGNDPDLTSSIYEKPINMSGGYNILKARVLTGDQMGPVYTFEYNIEFAVGTAILYSHDGYYMNASGNPVMYTINYSIPAVTAAGSDTAGVKAALKEKLMTYYEQYNNFLNGDFAIMNLRDLARWDVSYQIFKYKGLYTLVITDTTRSALSGGLESHMAYYYDAAVGNFISSSEYSSAGGYTESDIISRYNQSQEVLSGEVPAHSAADSIVYYYDSDGGPVFIFEKAL